MPTNNAPNPPDKSPVTPPAPGASIASGASITVEDAEGWAVDPRELAGLEQLDDTIFDALDGDAAALDRAAALWRRVRRTAPEPLVDQSREQYVRRALAIADEYAARPATTLGRRFAALEVLALMAE